MRDAYTLAIGQTEIRAILELINVIHRLKKKFTIEGN